MVISNCPDSKSGLICFKVKFLMPLINCPECGQQISDRAEKCIHCGHIMKVVPKKLCEDCGTEIPEGATECPHCGCPIKPESDTKPVPIYIRTKEPVYKKIYDKIGKKGIAICLAVIVVTVGGGVGASQAIAKKKAADAAAEAAQISEDYKTNYSYAALAMSTGAATAESCGNQIKNVWNNAIFKDYDSSTDKYTRPQGYFVDFNDALSNLFSDSSFSSDISSVKSSKEHVTIIAFL